MKSSGSVTSCTTSTTTAISSTRDGTAVVMNEMKLKTRRNSTRNSNSKSNACMVDSKRKRTDCSTKKSSNNEKENFIKDKSITTIIVDKSGII